jgi:hypothetical protein
MIQRKRTTKRKRKTLTHLLFMKTTIMGSLL